MRHRCDLQTKDFIGCYHSGSAVYIILIDNRESYLFVHFDFQRIDLDALRLSKAMVDIASHQQLTEIFASEPTTMTNGHRFAADDLSKRAELVLGQATALLDYNRQPSFDYATRFSSFHFPNSSPPSSTMTTTIKRDRQMHMIEKLVPLIFQVMKIDRLRKYPVKIVRDSKHTENVTESREESLHLTDDEDNLPVVVPPPPPPPPVPIKTERIRESDEEMSMSSDDENEEHEEEQTNPLNPNNLSLIDFLRHSHSPVKSPVHQPVQVQSKKEDLVKAFSSSVNIPIDLKQPTLTIAIPKHLFIEPSKRTLDESTNNEITSKKCKTSQTHVDVPVQTTTTVAPLNSQPKKEKPTANVKPLLQSTNVDPLLSSNSTNPNPNANVDRLANNGQMPIVNPARRIYSDCLRTSSNRQLHSLARDLKKKADQSRRTTFEEIRQSMSFYLESVCYFMKCASDEQVSQQRTALLTDILNMLQQLVQNHQRLFQIGSNHSVDASSHLRQKFLLINYWLQSYIYQLKFQNNWPSIERCANQVIEYLNQTKSPTFNGNSDNKTHFLVDFSEYMLLSYQSTHYWNKADRLMSDNTLKDFLEQLMKQNQNRRLSRDETTVDFILYIFDAIDLLRSTNER